MIKDNQQTLNRLHIVLDGIVTILAYTIAYLIMFRVLDRPVKPYSFSSYFRALIGIVPLNLVLNALFHLYYPKRVLGRRLEASNVLKANGIGFTLVMTALYLLGEVNFSRMLLILFYSLNTIFFIVERNLLRIILRGARKRGFNQKHILLVGYSRAAENFIDKVNANPQWGYKIRGILDDEEEYGKTYKGIPVIGVIDNLAEILSYNRLDEIIITLSLKKYERLEEIVNTCQKSGVHTKFIPDYNNIIPTKPYTEDLLGIPVIHIRHVPLTFGINIIIKRTMDIVGSLLALILFSPVMIITAIAIKIGSKGPLIYKQERVGLHNKPFMMYKFRSMAVQKPQEEAGKWTTPGDPRVTPIGRFIRSTSIDELPQLFNVLKGDMSLVGPRPERPFFL